MQTRIVHDAKGAWLVNLAKFSFVDPESGCRFDPNVPTQTKVTDWIKAQDAIIKPWVDPAGGEAAQLAAEAQAAADAEAAQLAAEAQAAADAEAAQLAATKKTK